MSGRRWDVICIGGAVVDIPLKPMSAEVFEHESFPVDRLAMTIGGDAINEATILSRLGLRSSLIGLVGKDVPGRFIRDFCTANAVDTTGLVCDPAVDTSINVGMVRADGQRTFVSNRNGSLWKTSLEHVDLSLLREARLLSLASIFNSPLLDSEALVKIFSEAKKHGLILCADVIKSRLGEGLADIKEALSYLDYFFPNFEEASSLTGKTELSDMADVFLDCGVKNVVIKNGRKGCYLKNQQEAFALPEYTAAVVADTIGAGDNFVAGFLASILAGRTFRGCGEYATAVASLAVEGYGATSGVQNAEQVEKRYRLYKQQIAER